MTHTHTFRVRSSGQQFNAILVALVGLACSGALAAPAAATMTLRVSLAQMVAAADRAFVGRVVSVESGRDGAGVPSTRVTFAVSEAIAGDVGSTVSIKQIGVIEPLSDGTVFHPAGVPTYQVGEELVLFLSGESPAGFCSPIGLGQGKFRIAHRDGRAVVTANVENAEMLRPLQRQRQANAAPTVEADLDQFLNLVHQLAAHNQ